MNNIFLTTSSGGKYVYLGCVVKNNETHLVVGGLLGNQIIDLPIKRFKLQESCANELLIEYYKKEKL